MAVTRETLLEGLDALAYYSYFYSGVRAVIATLPDEAKDAWCSEMEKKLRRLKSTKYLQKHLHDIFLEACPQVFTEEDGELVEEPNTVFTESDFQLEK